MSVNGESFAGLNFHDIPIILAFAVILLQYKAKPLVFNTYSKRFKEKLLRSSKKP